MTVDFWFEFASTYSYPAAMRIEEVAARKGVSVRWRPFLLGPIFKALGWNDSPFNLQPAKGRYMWRDLERVCASQQIPFTPPANFPRNGLLAARIACHFSEEPWLPVFVRAVYRANFAEDRDIASRGTLEHCLRAAGQDPEPILALTDDPAVKDALRAQTQEAMRLGIFGAPFFVVGGHELFWGNDRLEDAIAWCVAAGASPARSSAN
jgi:2-hydroxychromene-2-carboxylate isomerase